MFTNLPKVLIKEDSDKQLWFYPLTENQAITLKADMSNTPSTQYGVNYLTSKYGIDPRTILMYGDVKLTENTAKNLLDFDFIEDKLNNIKAHNYKCFCSGDLHLKTIVVHKTAMSSWYCMLTKLCNPKFGLIITIKKS